MQNKRILISRMQMENILYLLLAKHSACFITFGKEEITLLLNHVCCRILLNLNESYRFSSNIRLQFN